MINPEQHVATLCYGTSLGCVLASWLEWLGQYSLGLGVLLAIATFATNFYFQKRRDRRDKTRLKNELENK